MSISKMACPIDISVPDDIADFEQYERYLNKLLAIVVRTAIDEAIIYINNAEGTTYPILKRSTRFPEEAKYSDMDYWGVFNGHMKNIDSFNAGFFRKFRRAVYKILYYLDQRSIWAATHDNLNSLEIRLLSNRVIVLMVWYPTVNDVRQYG